MKTKGILFLCCIISIDCFAQRVVIDAKCIEQVMTNGGAAAAQERIIQMNYNNGKASQRMASLALTSVQSTLFLYNKSLQNVQAFGEDSRNVKEIAVLATRIIKLIPEVLAEVNKNPKATITSRKMLASLMFEAVQCCDYMKGIVANGEIDIPGVYMTVGNVDDGANLLDPKQRLDLANHLIVNLRRMYNILLQIKYQLMYSSNWGQVFQQAMPFHHYIIFDSKELVDDIIGSFGVLNN